MTCISTWGYLIYHPEWEEFIRFEQTHDGRGTELSWDSESDPNRMEQVDEETFGIIYYKTAYDDDRRWMDEMVMVPFIDNSKTGLDVDFSEAIPVPIFVRDYVPEKYKS